MHTPLIKLSSDNKIQPNNEPVLDWPSLIKNWEKSNLSQMVFCEKNNLNFNQFTYQRSKLRHQTGSKQLSLPATLLPIKLIDEKISLTTDYTLHLPNKVSLVIPKHFIANDIKQLLLLLGITL